MTEELFLYDQKLLKVINQDLAHPVLDWFFVFWTDVQKNPLTLVILLALFIFWGVKKKWPTIIFTLYAFFCTWIAGRINAQMLKPFFYRSRPTDITLRATAGGFSFPSGHTVTAFTLAVMMGLYFPRFRMLFLCLAFLTGYSRMYLGVHYPLDVFAGALVGMALGYIFDKTFYLMRDKTMKRLALFVLVFSAPVMAFEDPTGGKPFFPWAWEDNLKPTFKKSVDGTGVTIAGSAVASTVILRQYDKNIYQYNQEHGNFLISEKDAVNMGKLGNGVVGIGIAAGQLFFDSKNGVKTLQTMILTSTSHIGISALTRRNRPDNRSDFLPWPSSFPSGHTSNAFAVAGALAYSYGWVAGVPAYAVASAIGISRIEEDRHWASDVVAGAFLGTFWARASFKAEKPKEDEVTFVPAPIFDGMMLTAIKRF